MGKKEKIKIWKHSLNCLVDVTNIFPQASFVSIQKSLQQEWVFIQRVTNIDNQIYLPLENIIKDKYLPNLFNNTPPDRSLTKLPIKSAGLSIPDPTETSSYHFDNSYSLTLPIQQSILEKTNLNVKIFNKELHLERRKFEEKSNILSGLKLESILNSLHKIESRTLERATTTGFWLSIVPNWFNGNELSREEFQDCLCLRYGLLPSNLPKICDGCGRESSLQHALNCKCGGNIIARHNEIRDELSALTRLDFTGVWEEPRIFKSHSELMDYKLFKNRWKCLMDTIQKKVWLILL